MPPRKNAPPPATPGTRTRSRATGQPEEYPRYSPLPPPTRPRRGQTAPPTDVPSPVASPARPIARATSSPPTPTPRDREINYDLQDDDDDDDDDDGDDDDDDEDDDDDDGEEEEETEEEEEEEEIEEEEVQEAEAGQRQPQQDPLVVILRFLLRCCVVLCSKVELLLPRSLGLVLNHLRTTTLPPLFAALERAIGWIFGFRWVQTFILTWFGLSILINLSDGVRYLSPIPDHALCMFDPVRSISAYRSTWTGRDWCQDSIRTTTPEFRVDSIHWALETFAWIETITTDTIHEDLHAYQNTTAEMANDLAPFFDAILPTDHFTDLKFYTGRLQYSLSTLENKAKKLDSGMQTAVEVIRNDIHKLFVKMQDIDTTWSNMTRTERARAFLSTLMHPNEDATTRLAQAIHSFATYASAESATQVGHANELVTHLSRFLDICAKTHKRLTTEVKMKRQFCQHAAVDAGWEWHEFWKQPARYTAQQLLDKIHPPNMTVAQRRRMHCDQGRVADLRCCQQYLHLRHHLDHAAHKAKSLQGYNGRLMDLWGALGEQLQPAMVPVTQDWKPLDVFAGWKARLVGRWAALQKELPGEKGVENFREMHDKHGWAMFMTP